MTHTSAELHQMAVDTTCETLGHVLADGEEITQGAIALAVERAIVNVREHTHSARVIDTQRVEDAVLHWLEEEVS